MTDKQKKVIRVDKLGDVCAYKPDCIQVLGEVYDKVPADKKEDFDAVLVSSREKYEGMVAKAKAAGEKPKSAQYKAEAIVSIVKPFLEGLGIESGKGSKKADSKEKVIKPKDPKITDAKDPVKVDTEPIDTKAAEEFYDNNFAEDALDDSAEETPQEEGFEGNEFGDELSDGFDVDDGFDFEGIDGKLEEAAENSVKEQEEEKKPDFEDEVLGDDMFGDDEF